MALSSLLRRLSSNKTQPSEIERSDASSDTTAEEAEQTEEESTPVNEANSKEDTGKSKGTREPQNVSEDERQDELSNDNRHTSRHSFVSLIPIKFSSSRSQRKGQRDSAVEITDAPSSRRRFSQHISFTKSGPVDESEKADEVRQTSEIEDKGEPPLASEVARKGPEGIVTIEIGTEITKFYVHKDFLMHHSGYFKKALAGPWKETEERLVTLDDVEVAPFNVFVHWLYTQKLPQNTEEWVKVSDTKKWKIELVELKTLILADRFIMPEFYRALNNDLVNGRMKHAPYYELVIHGFDNLPADSPFLTLMVHTHCQHWEPKTDENDEEELQLRPQLPHEFLVKVMIRYAELKRDHEGKLKKLNRCDYHLHETDEEKASCGK